MGVPLGKGTDFCRAVPLIMSVMAISATCGLGGSLLPSDLEQDLQPAVGDGIELRRHLVIGRDTPAPDRRNPAPH